MEISLSRTGVLYLAHDQASTRRGIFSGDIASWSTNKRPLNGDNYRFIL